MYNKPIDKSEIAILCSLIGMIGFFYITIIGGFFFICTKMFEYSLWCIFGKSVPWYGDLLGAMILNGFNFPIFGICLIMRMCGIDTPFIEI